MQEKDASSTHGDDIDEDFTYDEAVNTHAGNINQQVDTDLSGGTYRLDSNSVVRLKEVKIEVKSDTKDESRKRKTPAKVTPFDSGFE